MAKQTIVSFRRENAILCSSSHGPQRLTVPSIAAQPNLLRACGYERGPALSCLRLVYMERPPAAFHM
jgi:hypothetical protein